MSQLHRILVVLAALTLCLSFAVPAEDDPETFYDESESVPYESTPLFSVMLQDSARDLQSVLISALLPRVNPTARRDEVLAEQWARTPHPTYRSVTILDHSLRC